MDKKPIYVGISRHVISRVSQHLNSDSPYSASLAFKMANYGREPKMSRNVDYWNDTERRAFKDKRNYLRSLAVAFVPIDDHVTMYLFEVNAAMEYDTHPWNTFRTH